MNNKDDFFLKQMRGVNPIKKNNRITKDVPKATHINIKKKKTKQTSKITFSTNKQIKKTEFN